MASAELPRNVHRSSHPCIQAKLSRLRSHTTTNAKEVQSLIKEITTMLATEALSHSLTTVTTGSDESPLGYEFSTVTVSPSKICVVPILRSGLSMVEAVTDLLPISVPVNHLGLYREKSTLQPVEYYNNLPYHKANPEDSNGGGPAELAILIDPVIATGATAMAAVDTLREWGVKKVLLLSILSSVGGLKRVADMWDDVDVWVGGCDKETDARGMIKPGLGDIGDRLFLTMGK